MVKSCDTAWPWRLCRRPRRAGELARASLARAERRAGPIMDMKVQGSRSGKALGIGELLASACSASATLDRS